MVETQIHQLWLGFPESHAAAIKHAVITIEKTIGPMKSYLQVKTVSTAEQMARPHLVPCTTAQVSGSRPHEEAETDIEIPKSPVRPLDLEVTCLKGGS